MFFCHSVRRCGLQRHVGVMEGMDNTLLGVGCQGREEWKQ